MKKIIICFILFVFILFNIRPLYSEEIPDKTIDAQIAEEMKWLREESFDVEVVTANAIKLRKPLIKNQ